MTHNITAAGTYIFLGPEAGKKQDAISEIRKRLCSGGVPEETVFYAGETPAQTIADSVLNHSLFSPVRLFLIKNAEQFKEKSEITLLASCMNKTESSTTLILVSDELRLAAGLESACPGENRRVFYELFENEKNEWVRSYFRRAGYNIDDSGIETILELVENNTEALGRECSRLMYFLPKNHPVSAEDAEQWLSHNREESAFTLFSRIAAGDIARSAESLHTLLGAKEKPRGILAGLTWCLKKLRDYLAITEKTGVGSYNLKEIGITSPKAKADYANAARRYNTAAVNTCLALTGEYDILTRASGAAWESILMDLYLCKIIGLAEN